MAKKWLTLYTTDLPDKALETCFLTCKMWVLSGIKTPHLWSRATKRHETGHCWFPHASFKSEDTCWGYGRYPWIAFSSMQDIWSTCQVFISSSKVFLPSIIYPSSRSTHARACAHPPTATSATRVRTAADRATAGTLHGQHPLKNARGQRPRGV